MGGQPQKKLTPKEEARQNKRIIDRAARRVDRERQKLEMSEKKLLNEVKNLAKTNKHGPAKILIKDIVRIRHQVDMYYGMSSQLKAMGMKVGTIQTNAEISEALKSATTTMQHVNQTMEIKDIQKVLKEFAKESQKMELGQEAQMNDAIDMGMEDYGDEQEIDKVYGQICDEIGVELASDGNPVPSGQIGVASGPQQNAVGDLEERLNQLKR